MQIKTPEGNMDVASNSKANTAIGLSIGALAAALGGNGNGGLFGMFGGDRGRYDRERNDRYEESHFVTKDELGMAMQLAKKDSTIALLESEKSTDAKLVDVYKASAAQDKELRNLINLSKAEQAAVNAQQMAYNAAANASIDVLKSQVMALNGVTKVFIPSENVCRSECGCGCVRQ